MAKTKFCDLTDEEFIEYNTGYEPEIVELYAAPSKFFEPVKNLTLPNSFDWRKKGAITPVKNQSKKFVWNF